MKSMKNPDTVKFQKDGWKKQMMYSEQLAVANNLMAPEAYALITEDAMVFGEELYRNIIRMLAEN